MHVSGTIQKIYAADIDAVASVNWTVPNNRLKTSIDYYEVMLIGSHTSNTIRIDEIAPLQTYSYSFGISHANYSAVNVTAVDVCGQRSEASKSLFYSNQSVSNSQRSAIVGLAFVFTIYNVNRHY